MAGIAGREGGKQAFSALDFSAHSQVFAVFS